MENKVKEKIYSIFEKLKNDKKTMLIIVIGILGMLMISISEFSGDEVIETDIGNENVDYNISNQKEELEKIIGEISGVGRVKVMVTYECSNEKIFAYDKAEQNEDKNQKISSEYIIVDGGNEENGLLLKEIFPKVLGVAVVCEGGDNPTVQNEITMLIKAVYDISSNNISISEMRK